MWGAGAGPGGKGSSAADEAGVAGDKARLLLAEQHSAAVAAGSLLGDTAATAGAGGTPPTGTPSMATPFSAIGYRQLSPSLGYSSASSSASATPIYSPEDWARHLPALTTSAAAHSARSFAGQPSDTAASSPATAQRVADFHFAPPGSRDGEGGMFAAALVGEAAVPGSGPLWQPRLGFAESFPPSLSASPDYLSAAARRGLPPSASSHSSPYSASPPLLSPRAASQPHDEDVWALEVAKINRQAAIQQYLQRQQQLVQEQQQQRSGGLGLRMDASLAAALGPTSASPVPTGLQPALPLGPPLNRPSSAQSKLLGLLSRSEDEALKRQQQFLYPRQLPQPEQSSGAPPHSTLVSPASPSVSHRQRRVSDRTVQYDAGDVHATPMRFAAPALRTSPSLMPFNAPPPIQSRSSSTPQTGSGRAPMPSASPVVESAGFAFGAKPVAARSPSPRTVSASQPFQPRESFSTLASLPTSYASLPAAEQQRYGSTDPRLLHFQRPFLSSSDPRSAPLSPTSAEVAAAASAYLTDPMESITDTAALAPFLAARQQQQQARAGPQPFDWPPQQSESSSVHTFFSEQALSEVQSVAVQHILADRAAQQQSQQQQQQLEQRNSSEAFPSSVLALAAPSQQSAFGEPPSHPAQRPLPLSHSSRAERNFLPLHAFAESSALTSPSVLSVSSAASTASSASSLSQLAALQLLAAAGVLPSFAQAQAVYEAAAQASPAPAFEPPLASPYADFQQQQQAQSAESPYFSAARLPWLSGYPFAQSDAPTELSSQRHRSFVVGAGGSEAEARVKEAEDTAELERLVAQHRRQQQQQSQAERYELAGFQPGGYQPTYYFQPGQLGASAEQQRQQQQQAYVELQRQQGFYVPAPSPTLGLPSDLPASTPVFSSSLRDVPRFSSDVEAAASTARPAEGSMEYAALLSREAGQSAYASSELSSAIPTFSSSMPSDSPRPSSLAQSRQSVPSAASSTKRRAAGPVSSAELWVCPFNCDKVYRTTSSRSIGRHLLNCPNKSLYESLVAAGRAAGVDGALGLGKRKQKKRRKNAELLEHERWNCPNGCGTFFRSTSTKSIHRHKRLCRFGLPDSPERPPDEDEDEGEGEREGEGEEAEQREEDDEGEQGDDDADDEDGDEQVDVDSDGKGSAMQAQQASRSARTAQREVEGGVDEVAAQLLSLSLSSDAPRSRYALQAPTTARASHRVAPNTVDSGAKEKRDERRPEHKQPQLSQPPTRSSSTPPLLFVPLASAAQPVALGGSTQRAVQHRRHSFDLPSAPSLGPQRRPSSRSTPSWMHSHDDDALFPTAAQSHHRADSQSGTDSGGSGSKNSTQSSASASLSSSSESSASSSLSSSSAASSSLSSAASSSPASLVHTPPRLSPNSTHRSLATTAQRLSDDSGRKPMRRASSHDESHALLDFAPSAQHALAKQPPVSLSSLPASAAHSAGQHTSPTPYPYPFPASSSEQLSLSEQPPAGPVGAKSRSARQLQLHKTTAAEAADTHKRDEAERRESKQRTSE